MKQRTKRVFALLMALVMALSFAGVLGACGDLVGKDKDTDKDDPCANGHTIVAVAEKPATETEAGYEAYWKCSVCNKMFSDKDGKTQISKPVEIPKLTPKGDDDEFTPITAPVAGQYYMGMKCSGDVYYYLKGGMNGYYMATSTNKDEAVIVELIADGDGWLLKQGNQYMEIENSNGHTNAVYKTARTAGKNWTWDSTYNIFTWENGTYFYGTYGSFNTIGGSVYAQHAASNYKAQLGTFGEQKVETPDPASVTLDKTKDMVLLASHANKYMSVKATVQPANAPQDVTWSISANTANIAVSDNGRITWTETEGEATVTATATGTDKTASVKVKVQDVHGATQDDPLTVDEALALMTEDGEVFAGYAANMKQGFYLTGTVENSKYTSRTQNSYWTFDMTGSDSKKITCTAQFGSLVGSRFDGGLDGYTVLMRNVVLKKANTTYTVGSVEDLASGVSATRPAVTSITIDETAEVNMPLQTKINVKSVLPANSQLDGTEVWHTSDESKATVNNEGMVTGVAAGTVQVWVSVGSVESNKCSVTVNAAASENKFTFDWTTKLTADSVADAVYDSSPSKRKNHLTDYLNVWTPGQTEITAVTFSQDVMISRDTTIGGFGFFPGAEAGTAQITTEHTIKKITFKIIALSYAEDIKLTVNDQQITHAKDDVTYNGKLDTAFEITVELTEASKTINMSAEVVKGNAFVIVGMTLEWDE